MWGTLKVGKTTTELQIILIALKQKQNDIQSAQYAKTIHLSLTSVIDNSHAHCYHHCKQIVSITVNTLTEAVKSNPFIFGKHA